MPEDSRDEDESGWLLEPAGSGEVHVSIAIGSDVELSPEARDALEAFMSGVEESEVSGFEFEVAGRCPSYRICNVFGKCQPRETWPCARFVHCRIAEIL